MDFDAASEMLSSVAVNSKKPAECVCPNCQRNMAASRFAPHLEKCMGMGRNSSRLASRRIATSASRQVRCLIVNPLRTPATNSCGMVNSLGRFGERR